MRPTTRATVAAAAALLLTLTGCGSEEGPGPAQEVAADAGAAEDPGTGDEVGTDLQPARDGLATWLLVNRPETPQTSTSIPGCPAIAVERVEEALAAVGYPDTTLGGWATEIEWDEYEDVHPDLMGLVCGGDTDGNTNDGDWMIASGVLAVDLADLADFREMLPAMGLPDVTTMPTPEGFAGEVISACTVPEFCVAFWHHDGFVVAVPLLADGADEEKATAVLVDLLPDVLTTLAEG